LNIDKNGLGDDVLNLFSTYGLHFTFDNGVKHFMECGTYVWKVDIPDDAQVNELEHRVFAADRIIISSPRKLSYHDCLESVKFCGHNIQCVPDDIITKELCETAASGSHPPHLVHIPKRFRSKKLCTILVSENYKNLKYVPENTKTNEICMIAVKAHYYALEFVPDRLKTNEICMIAMKDSSHAIEFIPYGKRTKEICDIIATGRYGRLIDYVPHNLLTESYCKTAMENDINTFVLIPDEYKTKKLCEMAVEKCGSNVLKHIPERLKTEI
jgi:hypothetical protein